MHDLMVFVVCMLMVPLSYAFHVAISLCVSALDLQAKGKMPAIFKA